MKKILSLNAMIELLKTIAEKKHLRILVLLYHEDLTISDLSFILGQTQSCVSRCLCLLHEAQLVTCYQKVNRTYFKFYYNYFGENFILAVISALSKHDGVLACDFARLMDVKNQRRKTRKEEFLQNVRQWDTLRLSYISDNIIENALLEIVGDQPFETILSIRIKTEPVLELLSGLYSHAVEVVLDSNVLSLSVGDTVFDLVIFHWALHFLENPENALQEVARVLRPHGRLLIVDFIDHEVEPSHSCSAPIKPRLSKLQITQWIKNAGIILEQTVNLASMQKKNNGKRIPTLWLARDPRLLIDDIKDKKIDFA
ncbi:ArsR family transcriptional regulator [Bartonella silvatica]|uniref:ArsR family transcriptional regulator n=1 Tax=Bartonella silvatica TaxID=357760 RepID=A0ABV2HI91_9HYPH